MESETVRVETPKKSCSGCFFYDYGPYGMFPECKLYKKRPTARGTSFFVRKPDFCKTTIAFINYG